MAGGGGTHGTRQAKPWRRGEGWVGWGGRQNQPHREANPAVVPRALRAEGAVAIWVERQGKAREGKLPEAAWPCAIGCGGGGGGRELGARGWDGMCDGREGWVGPGGVGVGWRCVMKRGTHWLAVAGLVGGSPLAARFPPPSSPTNSAAAHLKPTPLISFACCIAFPGRVIGGQVKGLRLAVFAG